MKAIVAKYGSAIGLIVGGVLAILVGQGVLTEEQAYNIGGAIVAMSGGMIAVAKKS